MGEDPIWLYICCGHCVGKQSGVLNIGFLVTSSPPPSYPPYPPPHPLTPSSPPHPTMP